MLYEFEYFYIHNGQLLLGRSVELMEELLELANREQQLSRKKESKKSLKENQRRSSSPSL